MVFVDSQGYRHMMASWHDFIENNQYAISVPVVRQSRSPLYKRGEGFGIESYQIDGNDVLISYAVTRTALDAARSGAMAHC